MPKNELTNEKKSRRSWPADCVWPEPLWDGEGGILWEEDFLPLELDEEGQALLDIKEYYDGLTEEGVLDEDYHLIDPYGGWEPDSFDEDEEWNPEYGEEYWAGDQFLLDEWQEDLSDHMNLLKISAYDMAADSAIPIRSIIGYDFINENLLRQAFTRRAFQVEHGLGGCSEELEFLGDTILGMVVTREIAENLTVLTIERTDAPFEVKRGYKEGELSRLKSHFVSKEYLSERAAELGLDRYILYGTGEEPAESSREDMMEALIGAVMIDCGWDWNVIEDVVDRLLCLQLAAPDQILKKSYYDIFNAWHQKHFGKVPDYDLHYRAGRPGGPKYYTCIIRFHVPENDKQVETSQLFTAESSSRSRARERAAMDAYSFVRSQGLWVNLSDANIKPDPEKSINQLQELFQKKYVGLPVYEFSEEPGDQWLCDCICDDVFGFGRAGSKTAAKKKAAYMVLVRLMEE